MKKKLYIGCALTRLPPEKEKDFLQMLADIKIGLGDHFEIIEFLGLTGLANDATAEEVYIHDIQKSVMTADCMLALCDYPSLGLGYELATAIERKGIPVLAMSAKNSLVSKLIRGINHKDFHFFYYDSVDEIISKTVAILTK